MKNDVERSFPMGTDSHEAKSKCAPSRRGRITGRLPFPKRANGFNPTKSAILSGLSHGIGWCAPQQGTCKLTPQMSRKRHCRRGAGRNDRLLGHDPFGRYGCRNSARQDPARMPEHRPCVRRDQRRHARNLQAAGLWPQPVGLFGGRPAGRRRAGSIGQGPAFSGRHHVSTKLKGVRYMEMAEGYITKAWRWTKTTRSPAISLCGWARCSEDIRHGVTPDEAYAKEYRHLRTF